MVGIAGAEPWSAAGAGPRSGIGVIVVHGFTSSPIATRPLGQRLAAEGYTVEVPLLPGHGTHYRELGRTRYADWFATIDHLVDHLGARCREVVLVGHSVGGTISLDVASRRPEDVAAVAVINPVVLDRPGVLAKVAGVLQHVVPYLPRDLAGMPTDDLARPDVEEAAYAMVPAKASQSLLEELPRIRGQLTDLTQPLLVVRSPNDHTVRPDNALALLELTGSDDVRELVCERSYHLPQIDYDAPKVAEGVVDFLAEVTVAEPG